MTFRVSQLQRQRQADGEGFEHLARLAVERYVQLFNIPECGARHIGGGQVVRDKTCCDLGGVIRGSGRAFLADAKRCSNKTRFPFASVREHQRDELVACGGAGAVAGLIVEAADPDVRAIVWIPWQVLVPRRGDTASVQWDDERLIVLGDNHTLPDLTRVIKQEGR